MNIPGQVITECLEVLQGEPNQVCVAGCEHRTLDCPEGLDPVSLL